MRTRSIVRGGLRVGAMLFLLWLAWRALSGAVRQIPRSRTLGPKVETVTQLACGLLSLLVVITCFWRRAWAPSIRTTWGISLAAAAGLSSLVWGPPLPRVGVLFAALSLLMTRAVKRALDISLAT